MVERSIVTETGSIPPPVAGQLVEPGDPPSEQQGCEPQRRNKEVASGGPWAAKRAGPGPSDPATPAGNGHDPEDFEATAAAGESRGRRERQPFTPVRVQPYDVNGNKIAGWSRRAGAFAMDWGAIFAIEFAILIVFGFAGVGRIGTYIDAGLAISYFTFTIGGPHGQTPGMHLMGIAVIDEEKGEPPGYPKALLRLFLTTTFMTIVMIPLAIMWFFAIYDEKRQMVHDKAVGTVVIEFSAPTSVTQQGATPAAQLARPPAANGVANGVANGSAKPRTERTRLPIEPVLAFAKNYGVRIGVLCVGAAALAVVTTVVLHKISSTNAYNHSPARAATAYLTALSQKDVPAIQSASGIVTPADVAKGVDVIAVRE